MFNPSTNINITIILHDNEKIIPLNALPDRLRVPQMTDVFKGNLKTLFIDLDLFILIIKL